MHEACAQIVPGDETRRRELMTGVIHEYESPLVSYAMRLVGGDLANAQDVVQNVFIRLYQKWPPGMKPGAQLKAWLYRAVHNEAVDLVRRDQRRYKLHERQAAEPTAVKCEDGVHCEIEEKDRKALVLKLLSKLDTRERQVVLLRMQQGLSYKEIAAVTERTVGNVGNILHHAVQKLAAKVRRLEGGLA